VIQNGFVGQQWCDYCGNEFPSAMHPMSVNHTTCFEARKLEPPRYCGLCRRRMKVQVLPAGWRATCVEHGEIGSPATGATS
jgi:hypothetical protein